MKQLLSSCFALCSSAVLASSFALFAPGAAQASFTLIDDDNDSFIEGIAGLEIDGSLFNVDFVKAPASFVYSDGFSFDNYSDSAGALETVFSALGGASAEAQNGQTVQQLRLGYSFSGTFSLGVSYAWLAPGTTGTRDLYFSDADYPFWTWITLDNLGPGSGSGDDNNDRATTPEPSLILGFITLSGLMLGSKRKTKG